MACTINNRETYDQALTLLRTGSGIPTAEFRDGQYEAIEALVENDNPMLVVQKTGWGKSFVYFIATAILRSRGMGPAILISPLLALMRNQIVAAEKMGVRAVRITSDNTEKWDELEEQIRQGLVDVVLISPERLANHHFVQQVLSYIADQVCLLIIDEAHCVSDWGHDFRPNYRRIGRMISNMPTTMRMLATTATANDRVVEDLQNIFGDRLEITRGSLTRNNLHMQSMVKESPAERLAWMAYHIPRLEGSGIVYALTRRDAQRVTEWLQSQNILAECYTGKSENRVELEDKLLNNEIKVLVATVALGMGYDKPDIGFVIHYQCPQSVIGYYQQVGRAGRGIEAAYAVLFYGREDRSINEFFINSAFPTPEHVDEVLAAIDSYADDYVSVPKIEYVANIQESRIKHILAILALEVPAPVVNERQSWATTASPVPDSLWERASRLTLIRGHELDQMEQYVYLENGHMEFLITALDGDPEEVFPLELPDLSPDVPVETIEAALHFLNHAFLDLDVRHKWPAGGLPEYAVRGYIPAGLKAEPGKILCQYGDAGWGELVSQGKYETGRFDDRLIEGVISMIEEWECEIQPTWLTCIPSANHPDLVPDFARRLADRLGIEFIPCIEKVKDNQPQKMMVNSAKQALNLDGVFEVDEERVRDEPVFLFDDMRDSGWTMTVGAWLLRSTGTGEVVPIALASSAQSSE